MNDQTRTITSDSGSLPQHNPDYQVSVDNFASQADGKCVVLLQTAFIEAIGDQATTPVRVLLVNGSHCLHHHFSKDQTKTQAHPTRKAVPEHFWERFLHYKRI